MTCACDPGKFNVTLVRDMADKNFIVREFPETQGSEFIFLKDASQKLRGWTPEHIYYSVWCRSALDREAGSVLDYHNAKGAKIICLGS